MTQPIDYKAEVLRRFANIVVESRHLHGKWWIFKQIGQSGIGELLGSSDAEELAWQDAFYRLPVEAPATAEPRYVATTPPRYARFRKEPVKQSQPAADVLKCAYCRAEVVQDGNARWRHVNRDFYEQGLPHAADPGYSAKIVQQQPNPTPATAVDDSDVILSGSEFRKMLADHQRLQEESKSHAMIAAEYRNALWLACDGEEEPIVAVRNCLQDGNRSPANTIETTIAKLQQVTRELVEAAAEIGDVKGSYIRFQRALTAAKELLP